MKIQQPLISLQGIKSLILFLLKKKDNLKSLMFNTMKKLSHKDKALTPFSFKFFFIFYYFPVTFANSTGHHQWLPSLYATLFSTQQVKAGRSVLNNLWNLLVHLLLSGLFVSEQIHCTLTSLTGCNLKEVLNNC